MRVCDGDIHPRYTFAYGMVLIYLSEVCRYGCSRGEVVF